MTITETTSYPFRDTIKLALKLSKAATFPLTLRIPGWCANPTVKVNGTPVAFGGSGARYVDVARTWNDGDFSSWNGHRPLSESAPARRNWT